MSERICLDQITWKDYIIILYRYVPVDVKMFVKFGQNMYDLEIILTFSYIGPVTFSLVAIKDWESRQLLNIAFPCHLNTGCNWHDRNIVQ